MNIIVYDTSGRYLNRYEAQLPSCDLSAEGLANLVRSSIKKFDNGGYVSYDSDKYKGLFSWSYLYPENYCGAGQKDMLMKVEAGEMTKTEYDLWFNAYCNHCQYMKGGCTNAQKGDVER